MTAPADPLLAALLDAAADKRRRLAELENEELDRRLRALEQRVTRGERKQRHVARWLWTMAALCMLATLLITQRPRLAPVVSQLAARFGGQSIATVNGTPVSQQVMTLLTPQPTEPPTITAQPPTATTDTRSTIPQAPTGTPERAQQEPQAFNQQVQLNNTPIPTAAPPLPTPPVIVPSATPEPQQVLPTATQEPTGQPVQAAQPQPDAAQAEYGAIDWTDASANATAIAEVQALHGTKAQPAAGNPSTPQGQAPASSVIR
ncbi:MAG TPA: hypothetical protein VFT66_15520 [Roseiflexaceae bacterium]|nr:hypothetical protein [Roseiflexaceae bacterium]